MGPMAPGATPAAGAYIPTPRGPSSRTTLMIDWQHATAPREPVPTGSGGTTALPQRRALTAADALAAIAGADRRPLLVLRECLQCSGTEDALMSSKEDNERTYLLARWFHCVKLSPDVLEDDHPFRQLFPGAKPSHLFIANADGSSRHDLEGEHSRRELWNAMEAAIGASYQDDHAVALQKLARILDHLDEVDRSIAEMETRYELAISAGADARKVKKIQEDLTERRAERAELQAAAAKAAELEPRLPVPAPPAK